MFKLFIPLHTWELVMSASCSCNFLQCHKEEQKSFDIVFPLPPKVWGVCPTTMHWALTWLISLPALWFNKIIPDLFLRKRSAAHRPLRSYVHLSICLRHCISFKRCLIVHAGLSIQSNIFYTPYDTVRDVAGSIPNTFSGDRISSFRLRQTLGHSDPCVTGFSERAPDTSLCPSASMETSVKYILMFF